MWATWVPTGYLPGCCTVFCCTAYLVPPASCAATSLDDQRRSEQARAGQSRTRPGEAHRGTPPVLHASSSTSTSTATATATFITPRIAATTNTGAAAHKPTLSARTPSLPPPPFLLSDRPYLRSTARLLALLPSRNPVQYLLQSTRKSLQPWTTNGGPHPLPSSRTASCLQSHALHHPPSRHRHSIRLLKPRLG